MEYYSVMEKALGYENGKRQVREESEKMSLCHLNHPIKDKTRGSQTREMEREKSLKRLEGSSSAWVRLGGGRTAQISTAFSALLKLGRMTFRDKALWVTIPSGEKRGLESDSTDLHLPVQEGREGEDRQISRACWPPATHHQVQKDPMSRG